MPFASISETALVDDVSRFVRDGGLPAILLLMAISSACIPIPSEVVMLFAGFAVADPTQSAAHHHLTLFGVVAAGTLGCLVGSWVAYGVGYAGRLEIFQKHGAKLHIGPAQLDRADRFFARYGEVTVLFGRMLPFVRAFVSLPAGIARMPIARFSVTDRWIGSSSIPWVRRRWRWPATVQAASSDWTFDQERASTDVDVTWWCFLRSSSRIVYALVIRRRRRAARRAWPADTRRPHRRRQRPRRRRVGRPAAPPRHGARTPVARARRDPRTRARPHRGAAGLLLGAHRAEPLAGRLA